MLPAVVWPYFWTLCFVLLALCWLTSQRAATKALGAILCAYVTVRLSSLTMGELDTYNAVAALAWTCAATVVLRLKFTTASGIIAASVLCYFWANLSGAPRVVGSIPFVLSDALIVAAMLGIGWNGVVVFFNRAVHLAFGGRGRSGNISCGHGEVVQVKKMP